MPKVQITWSGNSGEMSNSSTYFNSFSDFDAYLGPYYDLQTVSLPTTFIRARVFPTIEYATDAVDKLSLTSLAANGYIKDLSALEAAMKANGITRIVEYVGEVDWWPGAPA